MSSKLTMRVTSLKKEIQLLRDAYQKETGVQLLRETGKMVRELEGSTPVLTGEARSSWSYHAIANNRIIIRNSVEYIQALNRGHSKQAPPFFIESIAIKYGRPEGGIVQIDS